MAGLVRYGIPPASALTWRPKARVAIDRAKLSRDLSRFYDFTGKEVIYVGAGHGQLLDPDGIRRLIAVEENPRAAEPLRARLAHRVSSMEVMVGSFDDVHKRADVVYFEFCLHEMQDPHKALTHAWELASDIVVFDHAAGSEWSFYAAEDQKVARSAEVMTSFGVRRRKQFVGEQRFRNYAELAAKLLSQGAPAAERARRFAGMTNIAIPMRYELALL
ncbi:MAG TPA: hypothetical protein VE994_19915 [Terriglobales bacterium]|nr:hypothetical protein [Terriglobales bacterium]